jgi:hypothetical protein
VAGYRVSKNFDNTVPNSKSFFSAARKAKKSFVCSPASEYDLEFQEDGGIVGTYKFEFVSETALKDDTFDVFDTVQLNEKDKKYRESKQEELRKQDNKESNVKASGKPEDPPKKEKGSKGDTAEKASDKKKQDFAKGLSKVYESIRNSILSKTYKISLPKGGLQNYLRVRQYAKGIQPEEGENTEGHRFKRSDIDNSKIVQSPFTSNDRISHGPVQLAYA